MNDSRLEYILQGPTLHADDFDTLRACDCVVPNGTRAPMGAEQLSPDESLTKHNAYL